MALRDRPKPVPQGRGKINKPKLLTNLSTFINPLIRKPIKNKKGFTLVEIAIILIVLGVLISFGVGTIRVLRTGNRLKEARQVVSNAKDSLTGFTIKNNRFPCPDTYGDGNFDGQEDCPYLPSSPYKNTKLPYVTVGIRGKDSYMKQLYYDVNKILTTTSSGYDFCTALKNITGDPRITQNGEDSSPIYSPAAAIVLSSSENMALDPKINNTDTRNYETKGITDNFDDIVEWIDPSSLLAKKGCQEGCSSYTVSNNKGADVYIRGDIYSNCTTINNGDRFNVRSGASVVVYSDSGCGTSQVTVVYADSITSTSDCQTEDMDEDCKVKIDTAYSLVDE